MDPGYGFHNLYRPREKTVDELRSKSNQKHTYKGQIIQGKSMIDERQNQISMNKNRPDTFYETTKDNYFVTNGAYTKETFKETLYQEKPRKLELINEYKGSANGLFKKSQAANDSMHYTEPTKTDQELNQIETAVGQI